MPLSEGCRLSGLEGVGDIEDQLHDNTGGNMWFSGCADAGIPGGSPDVDCAAEIFAVAPVDEQIVEFELDTTYDLSSPLAVAAAELAPRPAGAAGVMNTKPVAYRVSFNVVVAQAPFFPLSACGRMG